MATGGAAATLTPARTTTYQGRFRIVTTVVSKSKLPTNPQVVQAVREHCPSVSPPVLSTATTAYRHVCGPVLVPLGHGSLRINPAASVVPGLRVTSSASLFQNQLEAAYRS